MSLPTLRFPQTIPVANFNKMNQEYDYLIKILIIGESGVGKTCILQRFDQGGFSVNHLPTIAIDFKMKIVNFGPKRLKMQIWDTAGQERFNTLTASFFKCGLISLSWNHSNILDNRPQVLRMRAEVDGTDSSARAKKCKSCTCSQQGRYGSAESDFDRRG